MADRTVKVDTILGAGAKEGMEALGFKVKEVDGEVDRLNRDLKQTADETAKAAATMELLKAAVGDTNNKMAAFGGNRTVLSDLDEAIIKSQNEVRRLGEEFNRTGNVDVFKSFSKSQSGLSDLQKMRKELAKVLEDGAQDGGNQGGGAFGKAFMQSLTGVLTKPVLGPMSILIVGAILAILLPALDGAFIGLANLGGLATGIIGQLQNPKVRNAFVQFGDEMLGILGADTKVFAEPIIGALGGLKEDLKSALGTIDFSALSQQLRPLIAAIGEMITTMMPGFNKMLESSGPVMAALGQGIRMVGVALNDMFEMISNSGPGAALGLKMLFGILAGLLITIGGLFFVAARAFDGFITALDVGGKYVSRFLAELAKFIPVAGPIVAFLSRVIDGVHQVAERFRDVSPAVDTVGKSLTNVGARAVLTADDLKTLDSRLGATEITAASLEAKLAQKLFTTIMNQDQAVLGWNKSLLDLQDTLDQNGKAIDRHTGLVALNTQHGIANREAVLQVMTANMQQYQSTVALTGSTEAATEQYNKNTGALEGLLSKAGYTKRQIDDMIGSLRSVPGETHANILMNGLIAAINNLGNLIATLNGLNGQDYGFTVTEKHVYESDYLSHQLGEHRWGAIYQHAAAGMLGQADMYSATDPGRYVIAEPNTGGEAFVPRRGDYGRSTSILDQAARWYGGRFMPDGAGGAGGSVINLTVYAGMGTDGMATGRQIAKALAPYVRANGGNVQAAVVRQ